MIFCAALGLQSSSQSVWAQGKAPIYDVLVLQATPGGIAAAISAARLGQRVLLLERTAYIGGLPANGLGATDIGTRELAGGFYKEYVDSINSYYVRRYGAGSVQAKHAEMGFKFEPKAATAVFEAMLASQPNVELLTMAQFDPLPTNVQKSGQAIVSIAVLDRKTGQTKRYAAKQFIDASYEGDLVGAAGAPFVTGREGRSEYGESMAGKIYKAWKAGVQEQYSTGEADTTIQAYNYRLCITDSLPNALPFAKPSTYKREEYISLLADIKSGLVTKFSGFGACAAVVNPVRLPNRKYDANNHHCALLSTDLPEENWPWPKASWAWRDAFATRLRDYTLGLLWFCQNDPELPAWMREDANKYGLAKDEYLDNGHFPRQVYVREGRRMEGTYFFTAADALPSQPGGRPPVQSTSIAASHYAIDSHGSLKREPGRVSLDGFINYKTEPYTVPYGVIVPQQVPNLLSPTALSASHCGYGSLRMEPTFMALGQAAGTAAYLANKMQRSTQAVPVRTLQAHLLAAGAVLVHTPTVLLPDSANAGVQLAVLYGRPSGFGFVLDTAIAPGLFERWWLAAMPTKHTLGPLNMPATQRQATTLLARAFMREYHNTAAPKNDGDMKATKAGHARQKKSSLKKAQQTTHKTKHAGKSKRRKR